MSKILMIQSRATPFPGTAYLCGAARSAGHGFAVHLYRNDRSVLETLEREGPDIVGFSCMTGTHRDALRLAKLIKAAHPGLPIIMGGPHPTFFPEVIEEPVIDVICRGEGEHALIDLLDALREGWAKGLPKIRQLTNLHVKVNGEITKNPQRPLVDPLDGLPMVDWTCYAGTSVANAPPVAVPIRGCPYTCTYCFNAGYRELYQGIGRPVRMFSVERALREVTAALGVFDHSPVLFYSDTFGTDTVWMKSFLEGYEKITDLPFVLFLRPELATEQVIQTLAGSSCHAVAIGVESGSTRVRTQILNRQYSNSTLLRIAASLHKAGIPFRTYNMIGLPSESEEELWETVSLNVLMKADFPRGAIYTPMPGTRLTAMAEELGCLDESFTFDDVPRTVFSHSVIKGIDGNRLRNYLYFFQTAIVLPWSRPLIKTLVGAKPNTLFRLWFYLVYAYLQKKTDGRGFFSYAKYLFANRGYR